MQIGFEKSQPLGYKNSGSGFIKQKIDDIQHAVVYLSKI